MIERHKPTFGGFVKPLNDIQRMQVRKTMTVAMSEVDTIRECAKDFGFLIGHGQKEGLSLEVAFEAAKNHFRIYGKAMVEFAEIAERSGLKYEVMKEQDPKV